MSEYLTRENITLALSIFGSLGTLITFISSYHSKRKNLKIIVDNIAYKSNHEMLIIIFTFENHSQLPISICDMSVTINSDKIHASKYIHSVGEYTHKNGNEVIDRKFEYNLRFPVDIQQLCAVSGYVLFDVSPTMLENLSTPLKLAIRSTRGRVQKIELKPSQIEWF